MAISNLLIMPNLNPRIWDDNQKLFPEIRKKLLTISKEFLDEVVGAIKIKYVVLTGSLCTFHWRADSDWDLHIIAEPKEDSYKEVLLDYFATKSKEFNNRHDITLKGYKVEVNLKDIESEYEHKAIYDLIKDNWIIEPKEDQENMLFLDNPKVLELAHKFQNRIDDMIVKGAPLSDFKTLRDELKQLRTKGLQEGGEYSLGNLVFKTLRYSGHLQKIADYRLSLFDKELSLENFIKFYNTKISF